MDLLSNRREPSPFKILEGCLVSYNTQTGNIVGIYYERCNKENYWMEFQPSMITDAKGVAHIIRDKPTITTIFSGTMRPLHQTIEEVAEEYNKGTHKDKKE